MPHPQKIIITGGKLAAVRQQKSATLEKVSVKQNCSIFIVLLVLLEKEIVNKRKENEVKRNLKRK